MEDVFLYIYFWATTGVYQGWLDELTASFMGLIYGPNGLFFHFYAALS